MVQLAQRLIRPALTGAKYVCKSQEMEVASGYRPETAADEKLGCRENWRTDVVFAIS